MDHHQYLMAALKLAEGRRGFCFPNPAVGAVVVQEGAIIASGQHYASGHAHAEVLACQNLPSNLEQAVLYVTLEPCCHWGKTPPCTDMIIKKGIKKVFYAYPDPNPLVAGQGERILQQHGIECQQINVYGINEFYKSYSYWMLTQQPWVTCKLAISLDAKIADASGQPVAITGKKTQQLTHEYRLKSDAILTSVRTIINDNPALNVRLRDQTIAKPLYVLDAQMSLPLTSKIFQTTAKITVFHSVSDEHKIALFKERGVECRFISQEGANLNLSDVLQSIGKDGVHDLWVEAGGRVFSAFIRQSLAQKGILYVAPKLLGTNAYPAFSEDFNLFSQAKSVNWQHCGDDAICEMEFN